MPPDEPKLPTEQPADPPAAPAAPTVDLSNYVSREDYARIETQLAHQGRLLEAIAGGQARPNAPVDMRPQYTDDQLAEMLESGEGRKILEAQTYISQRAMAPFAREFVEFRNNTTLLAGQFNREIAEARGKLEHASDPGVRRAMDEFMSKLDPAAQANPQALELAYAHAVAQPDNLKRLVDARVEAELRKRAGADDPTGAPSRGAPAGRIPERASDQVPTVGELLGPGAVAAIKANGYTNVDDWVRKSQRGRYKNWPEMAKAIQAQNAADGETAETEDRFLQ